MNAKPQIAEEACHEIMVTVEVPATVDDAALCAAIQHEYDEGPMPNGGFILKDKRDNGQTRTVRIYFAVVLDPLTIEQELEYLSESLTVAMDELGGSYAIQGIGQEKPFSQIEAY